MFSNLITIFIRGSKMHPFVGAPTFFEDIFAFANPQREAFEDCRRRNRSSPLVFAAEMILDVALPLAARLKMAIDGPSAAESGDSALDAERVFELANKAYSLYLS